MRPKPDRRPLRSVRFQTLGCFSHFDTHADEKVLTKGHALSSLRVQYQPACAHQLFSFCHFHGFPFQNQTILVEFWGQELRRVSSPPRRLGVFPLPVTSSNGDWSRNLHLTHKHPASLSLQWKVKCSHGYAPHGVCSRFCVSSQCVSCHPDGVPRCRDGCTSSSCLGNVTAKGKI